MRFDVIIEVPMGSRNKYEMDHQRGAYPAGANPVHGDAVSSRLRFVPDTVAEDGDPLDALVLVAEPTFPGCQIHVRPLGVFALRDEHGPDATLLCVPAHDARQQDVRDLIDVPNHLLSEIATSSTSTSNLSRARPPRCWAGRIEPRPSRSSRRGPTVRRLIDVDTARATLRPGAELTGSR